MEAILSKFLPFMVVFAEGSEIIGNLVKWAATIGGGLVACFLIYAIVKEGIAYAKGSGSGSVLGIIGKALFLILMIGIIFLAQNYQNLGNTAKDLGQKGVDAVNENVGEIIDGQ